jgi:creatinine amidohydrolase/Fe(II)-dependent formamide hydrolase-like protein
MENILRNSLKYHLEQLPKLTHALLYSLAFAFSIPAWAVDVKSDTSSVQLENLTSTEVRDLVAAGSTTILIPIGGTEQTGPYVALGKHNFRAQILSEQIAQQLGKALVAPVIAYVPEGSITPPVAHMRFAGTISIPDAAFEAMLEGAARSFKQHGFKNIVLLGDHGGYKKNLERVAQKLNQEWSKNSDADHHAKVIALADYYKLSSTGFDAMLKKRGFSDAEIGTHAGLADTALTLAVDKNLVRTDAMARNPKPNERDGVYGDPRRATAELGQLGRQLIVDGSVAAIRAGIQAP